MYKRSFKDYFGRNRKVLYMILGILLVSTLSLTIVYAALNTVLNITGNAEVSSASWDIHLANVQLNSRSATTTAPTITNSTTATFSTTLTKPGDFYEFTIDVVNDGTIDAMIDGVTKTPTLTEEQAKYLNYIVEYQNGESINTKQLVSKNSFVRLKVRVEFRKDITASDLPTTSETLDLSFTVNYVQSDGTASSVKDNGEYINPITIVSGDGTNTGDEVCIGEECFYVMYSDDTTVTMLAKYNLHVGNTVDEDFNVTPLVSPTGKQDEDAIGYNLDYDDIELFPFIGTTAFSETSIDYSGSIVEGYVNSYNNYLITQGITPIEARLITKDELIGLGCSEEDLSCSEAPEWVYATSYWLGSAYSSGSVWSVIRYGEFVGHNSSDNFGFGCRPVITISKSLI